MNNELYKNAEGYTDPTAASTLSRKEPGDIWEYRDGECLVIRAHSGFATILRLHDRDTYGDRVKVVDWEDGPRYVDPAFLITGRYAEMGRFVETLGVENFDRVMDAVLDRLGVTGASNTAEVRGIQEDREKLRKERDFFRARATEMETLHASAVDRVNKVCFAKLKVVNQLELLQSMVGSVLAHFQVDTEED